MVGGPQTPIDTQTQHTMRALPRRYNHVWLFPFTWLPTSRREGGRHTAGGNLGPGQGSNPGVMHIFNVHSLGVFYSMGTATDMASGHFLFRAKAWAFLAPACQRWKHRRRRRRPVVAFVYTCVGWIGGLVLVW